MNYVRCDGTLTINPDNTLACDVWVSVTDAELLSAAISAHKVTQAEFWEIGAGVVTIMVAAVGVRVILKLIFGSR
jgi:hypothetical protein